MTAEMTDLQLLHELEPVVGTLIDRHMNMRKDWNPHDYIPWKEGKNYYALGGQDWDPEQSKLSEVAQTAMVQNLLTEDNLPSYHREIAMNMGMDGPWGFWVNRWTAEENRHGIALRDYLVVTRNCDPVELEELRVEQVTRGFSPGQNGQGDLFADKLFESVIYVSFQELATRVSHRNTGHQSGDPVCDRMLARIATDENLHMVFYRNLLKAAFELAPDLTMQAVRDVIVNFRMPGHGMPGFERAAAQMAIGEVYNMRIHHDDVLQPVLRFLKVMDIDGLGPEGSKAQEELGLFMGGLDAEALKFDEKLAARKSRMAARAGG